MNRTDAVDVVILGAGAAGLLAAVEAGRRGRGVRVLDHSEAAGKKILISGGGRCNFTNIHARPENYICSNPHFVKSALARYTPAEFIARVESHGIGYHEKTLGQLFCDGSAHQILQMLLAECSEAGVGIQLATRVVAVAATHPGFRVDTSTGSITAASLIVATGGLSIPKLGATAFGYEIARQFGHRIVETRPGLVPLVFSPADQSAWCDLAGVSTEVVVSVADDEPRQRGSARISSSAVRGLFQEKMLITHRGLSGPAILQVSSYWHPGQTLSLDLAPSLPAAFQPLTRPHSRRDREAAAHVLRGLLPTRLAERWLSFHAPASSTDPLSNDALITLDHDLHHGRIQPAGTEGYAKAEVTVGGVETDQLDARTLESCLQRGLYFIGEVVDVTGHLGGYNLQWAWSSAVSAGLSA